MNEFLSRLIVRDCGATDNVFSALNHVSGFAQACLYYSELKKWDDFICLAAQRIKEAKELIAKKIRRVPAGEGDNHGTINRNY